MTSQEKTIVGLTKLAYKENKKGFRPSLAGGWVKDNKTYITNGCWAFKGCKDYRNLEDFVEIDKAFYNDGYVNLDMFFDRFYEDKHKVECFVDFDNESLIEKSEMSDRDYIKIGKKWYDLQWGKKLSKCFKHPIYYECGEKYKTILFITDENKKEFGLILPYKLEEEKKIKIEK